MKPYSFCLLILWAGLPFLGACQNRSSGSAPGQDPVAATAPAPNSPGNPTSPSGPQQGTTDGGGGNGLVDGIYESYVVDPAQLPAFSLLRPIFDEWNRRMAETKHDFNPQKHGFERIRLTKKWYLAPVELQKIKGEVLGISFLKTPTIQYAIQKGLEIWMNKTLYDRLNPRAQADLILHEMVMSIYFLKFKKISELCEIALFSTQEIPDCKSAQEADEIYPPEKLRSLNSTDYSKIRFMTDFLKTQIKTVSIEVLYETFLKNGFDRRIFSQFKKQDGAGTGNSNPNKEFEWKSGEKAAALQKSILLGFVPDKCESQNGKSFNCALEINSSRSNSVWKNAQTFTLRSETGALLQTEQSIGDSVEHPFSFPDVAENVFLTALLPVPQANATVGTRGWNVILMFEDTPDRHLRGVIYLPYVVLEVTSKLPNVSCKAGRPRPTDAATQVYYSWYKKSDRVMMKALADRYLSSFCLPPVDNAR